MLRSTALAAALLCMPLTANADNNPFSGATSISVLMTREHDLPAKRPPIGGQSETCIASQYGIGDGYHGKRTASGARFDAWATNPYTVAHKTRALGSFVVVTNLATGRSIRAKVTDRGPFVRGRCVDVGRAGANALGMGGTAHVRVE